MPERFSFHVHFGSIRAIRNATLVFVLIVHAPRIVGALHNANEWTSGFVALAMSGGGLVAACALTLDSRRSA